MKKTLIVPSLMAAALLLTPVAARAESQAVPPKCEVRVATALSVTVPSNILAIPVFDTSSYGYTSVLGTPALTGPSPAGLTETMESRGGASRLLVLDRVLANDATYDLSYTLDCEADYGTVPGYGTKQTARFATGGPIALPTTSGTLSALPDTQPSPTTRVVLTPSPELEAYLPVTLVDVFVEGKLWVALPYGALSASSGSATISIGRGWTLVPSGYGGAYDLCGTEPDAVKKTFELRPHVAGATTDPTPVSVEATVDCKQIAPPPESSDAGPDDPGNGSAANAANAANAGGCQVGSSNVESAIPLSALALVVAVTTERRRRARRARSK